MRRQTRNQEGHFHLVSHSQSGRFIKQQSKNSDTRAAAAPRLPWSESVSPMYAAYSTDREHLSMMVNSAPRSASNCSPSRGISSTHTTH
jgi:hypothetical protein